MLCQSSLQQGTRAPISPPSHPAQICATRQREWWLCFDLRFSDRSLHVLLALWVSFSVNCPFRPCSVCKYSHDALLEVAPEGVGLVVLDLSVLHGAAPQVVIQLCAVDGRTALLVLGGALPDPEVDVLGEETAHSPGLGCSQRDQVRGQPASPVQLAPLAWGARSTQRLVPWPWQAPDRSPSLQWPL